MSEKDGPLGGDARRSGNTSPEETAALVTDKIARRGLRQVESHARRLERLEVVYVPIDAVKPNSYNPNRQDPETMELLKRSIREDGFTQPIIAQKSTGQIVDGEHRWRAARDEGMEQIPVVYVDMTDEQMRVATLRHNRARGSEDVELSAEVLKDLRELGALDWAQDSLMISDEEMMDLIDDLPSPEGLAADDFSDAWTPERGHTAEGGVDVDGSVDLVEEQEAIGVKAVASTRAATEEAKRRMEAIAGATTAKERTEVTRHLQLPYRVQFIFTGEEAEIVRDFLGKQPAQRLLDVCTELDPIELIKERAEREKRERASA